MTNISQPNIVTVERVFVTTHHICIMEELVTGGDLLSFMEHKNEQLREPQCAVIILQVLKAAEYLHAKNVVHRDIKPDNILMTSWKDGARVVLTDFGHARSMKSSHRRGAATRMFTTVGTLGYTAPEVHRLYTTLHGETGYSMAVDMWSIGTITALLMTGALIFPGNEGDESEQKLSKLRAAAKCDLSAIDQSKGRWALVTKRGKAFVKALLVLDEKKRLTATQALQHSWLSCAAYADELNTVYESAIENWRPRTTAGDVVHTDDNSASPVPPVHVRNKAVESTFFTEQHASAVHPASVSQRQYSTTPYSDNLLYNRKRWLKSKGALNISPDLGPDP
ncbi:hypothetical protein AAFC00_003425 [Neodothiora populina]|uniref:Protein kinase domain-containing protein n=1 Tax=Neodothiora populina TaxID=2781224 RepID=A0ABR3PE55_9PEZI